MDSRFWYLILLVGTKMSDVCLMSDTVAVTLTINNYEAKWTSDKLNEFQDCICNEKRETCTIDVDCDIEKCEVDKIRETDIKTEGPAHLYICNSTWWQNVKRHTSCQRQILSDSTGQRTKTNINNNFNIQCTTHCVDVIMQDITLTFYDNATALRPGLCMTTKTTMIVPTQMTTEYLPTSEKSANLDTTERHDKNSTSDNINRSSESENIVGSKDENNSLITGVVVGTAAAVVIAVCAVVGLLWRKRKHSENISKENHVSTHEAIPFQERLSSSVLYNVENLVYGFQEITDMEKPEKPSGVNIYCSPDSPVEINTDSRDNTHGSNEEDDYSFAEIPESTKNTVYTHLGQRTMEKTNPYDAWDQTESMTDSDQSNDYENHNVVSHMSKATENREKLSSAGNIDVNTYEDNVLDESRGYKKDSDTESVYSSADNLELTTHNGFTHLSETTRDMSNPYSNLHTAAN